MQLQRRLKTVILSLIREKIEFQKKSKKFLKNY